jgi:hypothetical protein
MLTYCFSSNDYCVLTNLWDVSHILPSGVPCWVYGRKQKSCSFLHTTSGVSNSNPTQASPAIKKSCQAICPFEQNNFVLKLTLVRILHIYCYYYFFFKFHWYWSAISSVMYVACYLSLLAHISSTTIPQASYWGKSSECFATKITRLQN